MNSYKLRGKNITLALTGVEELMSVSAPELFDGYDITKFHSSNGITNLYIESASPFTLRLQDESSGNWTDPYTCTGVFNLSNICLNDIAITPSLDGQTVYIFASGT